MHLGENSHESVGMEVSDYADWHGLHTNMQDFSALNAAFVDLIFAYIS